MSGLNQSVGVLAAVSHVQSGVDCAGQVNQVGVRNLELGIAVKRVMDW